MALNHFVVINILLVLFVIRVETGSVAFNSFESATTLSENTDSQTTLTTFNATCNHSYSCGFYNNESCLAIVSCTCTIPSSGLFNLSGSPSSYTLTKKSCTVPTCGNHPSTTVCSTSNGCANAGSESITVTCSNTHSSGDSASGTATHTITFTQEAAITITNLDGTASAFRTQSSGYAIFSTSTSGPTVVQWVESSSVSNSWILSTSNLFRLDIANGQVYINSNPSLEYSYTFSMTICAYSRRRNDCGTLTIDFSGCFQRPTCNDQSSTIADTHAIGATLFTMVVPAPTDHFTAISATFTGLGYTLTSTTLSVATLNSTTGVLSSTGNVTVFPSYPNKVYTMVVTVSNTDSCNYTSMCTMTLTVTFTNWPIDIQSLDTSVPIHEDLDARTLLHTIVTYDPNYESEDNVTCVETHNDESTLFELVHDGDHNYSSYSIYKKVCMDTGCGWLCTLGRGCLNHNLTQSYTFSVRCSDAYGLSDTGTLTINILQNAAPVWTNLPRTIIVNTDATSHLDVLYSFYYSDTENEDLDYNYTISPAQPSPALFEFDASGNYYSNPANVTSLQYQWPLGNETYTLYVCGTERRNTICDTLTIQRREFCGPTPTCDNAVNEVTDQFSSGGTLFTINAPAPATGSYTSLSYAIFSAVDLFDVNSASGVVTSKAALPITSPPTTTSYSITANVYDTAACGYAVCHLSLNVTFTNFPISITSMASVTTSLHEDTTVENTLHTITTSDSNPEDRATCVLDEANSVPANNGKFIVRETLTDSGVYVILNKEAPGFDYGTTTSYTVAVTCSDLYGSSASATMTVTIDENAQPTLTNLPASINVDPITATNGTDIFTMTYTDAENDAVVYFCNVTDTEQPLQCATGGVVSLRRNVLVPSEVGKTYTILMCITDTVHTHTLCATLSVMITSSKTNPVISNLPATVPFAESSNVGTVLFTVSVTDPDALDIHTYTLDDVLPENTRSLFTFVSTSGVLTLASSLNYETDVSYNFTFSVQDTYLPGLVYKTLYLQVTDVNEAPSLTLYTTSLTTTEGNTGQDIGTVIFACSDVDSGQTLTVTITSGTYMSYFNLDSATGRLTFAQNWDYESVSLPQSTVLVLTCSDGVGLTDSGTMTVSITPVNEFVPVPSITEIELTIYSTQRIQDTLFSVTATDEDYNDDGQFVYAITGNGEGVQYFTMSSAGHLTLTNYISWEYNYTFTFTVEVSDNETYPLKGSVNVTIHYIAPEAAPAPGRPTKCATCSRTGRIVVAVLIMSSVVAVGLFIHAVVRTKLWTVCQSEGLKTPVDRIKARKKQTHRQQQKREAMEMLQKLEEGDGPSDPPTDITRYTPNEGRLRDAIPTRPPPGPAMYLGRPDVRHLPDGVGTVETDVDTSMLPEPNVVLDQSVTASRPWKHNYSFAPVVVNNQPIRRIDDLKETFAGSRPSKHKLYGEPRVPDASLLANDPGYLIGRQRAMKRRLQTPF